MTPSAHTLLPHQQRALRYASARDAIALFMEMRLGKTPVAIRWTKARHARRVLLVAPLSTLLGSLNWEGELRREQIVPVSICRLPRSKRARALRPWKLVGDTLRRFWPKGWFLVNYEALRTQPEILDAPWDAIILDESTRIRSPKAQITKLLLKHTGHIEGKAVLSGLPNPEDPMDYFCQFKFLHGHFMKFDNYWAFRQAKFHTMWTSWDWQPNRGTRDAIKEYVHQHGFVLTRKDAKVGSAKVRQQRTVELNRNQRIAIRQLRKEFAIGDVETKWVPVVHTWIAKIAGGFHPTTLDILSDAKIRLLEQLVMEDFRKEPVVVWYRFNHEMEAAYDWLRRRNRKLKVKYLHGAVKNSKELRPRYQEEFQDGSLQVLMLQVKLGKYGWNLSRSSTAVYYSNSYEFEDRSQSEDRIVHLTKKNDCLYVDLVTEGTPDEDVVDSLGEKRMTARLFNSRLKDAALRLVGAA